MHPYSETHFFIFLSMDLCGGLLFAGWAVVLMVLFWGAYDFLIPCYPFFFWGGDRKTAVLGFFFLYVDHLGLYVLCTWPLPNGDPKMDHPIKWCFLNSLYAARKEGRKGERAQQAYWGSWFCVSPNFIYWGAKTQKRRTHKKTTETRIEQEISIYGNIK